MHIAQATGEAFSSQKRTSSTSKHELLKFFLMWVIFALLDPDPEPEDPLTRLNPDPEPWFPEQSTFC
jgi:hypothetical protein